LHGQSIEFLFGEVTLEAEEKLLYYSLPNFIVGDSELVNAPV